MTPDWSNAPGWAMWVAQDADGNWWWHQYQPERHVDSWKDGGQIAPATPWAITWHQSLQGRPGG